MWLYLQCTTLRTTAPLASPGDHPLLPAPPQVVIRSSAKAAGHTWLREHLRSNYTAAWHEVLASGEVDAAVQTPAFTTRWDNYWIEGILWLVRNLDIDGA